MFSANQKAMLRLIARGETEERIRQKLNLDREALRHCLDELYKQIGVSDPLEVIFFACSEEGKRLLDEREAA